MSNNQMNSVRPTLYPRPTWRRVLRLVLRRAGIKLLHTSNPAIPSLERIPPIESHLHEGRAETYYLPPGYVARTEPRYYNDLQTWDDYQKEVYEIGRMLADREKCLSVCDVGCGSAYKLINNFWDYDRVIGVDVPETVAWLGSRYPSYTWLTEDLSKHSTVQADLVIASDIIEHLVEPNLLLNYITSMQPRLVILSTPDRNLLLNGRHYGPPWNDCHIREWGYLEFHRYMSDYFTLMHHFVVHPSTTQMVVAKVRQ